MAEGVFRSHAASHLLIGTIDSAGTGAYHIGDSPDSRTMSTLRKQGITEYEHGARKITDADMKDFDYVFAMDSSNLRDLQRVQRRADAKGGKSKAKVMLFGEFGGGKGRRREEVEDPYYGGDRGFEVVFEQVTRFSRGFLEEVVGKGEGQMGKARRRRKEEGNSHLAPFLSVYNVLREPGIDPKTR
jgi:low molecular weight phosphotyrosine protein phosphatase